jgi:hypothetical protein
MPPPPAPAPFPSHAWESKPAAFPVLWRHLKKNVKILINHLLTVSKMISEYLTIYLMGDIVTQSFILIINLIAAY